MKLGTRKKYIKPNSLGGRYRDIVLPIRRLKKRFGVLKKRSDEYVVDKYEIRMKDVCYREYIWELDWIAKEITRLQGL